MDSPYELSVQESKPANPRLFPKKCIESFAKRIKKEEKDVKLTPKIHRKQIEKLVSRVENNSQNNTHIDLSSCVTQNSIKINENFINGLKLKNDINEFKASQDKKIQDFGNDFDELYERIPINEEEYYMTLKLNRIRSKTQDHRYQDHLTNYCDSITLIGHLANILPKLSDKPEYIWEKLIKPITEIS
ncbi:unnamed protein product [Brachionus calyciflorus]|uniref:Uncharacterized protein n=1 Tax=Brachionus calyciflorus TaxID=104777 RepID=A0A813VDT6_9BILA|nr:unnamed protein product [Brachionus calyciflorus]